MDSRPFSIVTPTLDGDVLEVLARGDVEVTGRDVQRLARHGSQSGIQEALLRLVRQGIVRQRPAGRAYLYSLNRDHLAAPAIQQIAGMRSALIARLREAVADWDVQPAFAALFGSVARGDASADSDLDILLVRPVDIDEDDPGWLEQRSLLSSQATAWTGNDARVLEYGDDELDALAPRESVLLAIDREGIHIGGSATRLRRALRGRR